MRSLFAVLLGGALATSPALAEDITLTLWTEQSQGAEATFAREFSDMDNGIKIEIREVRFDDIVTETLRAFATKTNPDLISIDNPDHAAFSARGAFLDLTPYVEKSEQIRMDNYFDGPRSSLTWQGGIYGIPRASNTIALYYNKDMFRAMGLDPDRPRQPGTSSMRPPRR